MRFVARIAFSVEPANADRQAVGTHRDLQVHDQVEEAWLGIA